MSLEMTALRTGRRVNWGRILGLLLVPLTIAGVLLWGLWNPQDRLENVSAAVVNNDEPVEVDGQLVPLGRLLAGELIDGDAEQNFNWVLTDKDDAADGLKADRYAVVVTIPKNFSEAATSLSGEPSDIKAAKVDITENERGRLIDPAISSAVTATATQVLNQQLGEQFVGNVYVGFNKLHSGIADAAGGASDLADGGRQLADGAGELADGTQQLADGTGQLADGASQLSGGAGQLAGGAGELATGSSKLAGGASDLAGGAGDLSDGVSEYVGGAKQLAKSYKPLAEGTTGAVTQLKKLIGALGTLKASRADITEGVGQVAGTATELTTELAALSAECDASGNGAEFCGKLDAFSEKLTPGLTKAGAGAQGIRSVMAELEQQVPSNGGSGDPIKDLDTLLTGVSDFGDGLDTLADQGGALKSGAKKLAGGASSLSDGASSLNDGTSQLATGASDLATGSQELATGTSELAANTPALADGAEQLADGTKQSSKGAGQLAEGLGEALTGIPQTTEAERDKISTAALEPVVAKGASDQLFNASGVPLFAGIALWAGALAMFLLLAPLWSRTREAARGVVGITLRSAAPAAALGALQGAIAGIVLPLALGYDIGQGSQFFALATLAGVSFALIVQGLSALLGGVGRFIAFALLVVSFAVGIVSTTPDALAAISNASPIGAAFTGFQSVASGISGGGGAAAILVLWALAGLVLTALGVRRARKAAHA